VTAALEICDLHVHLPEARSGKLRPILRGIDLSVAAGEAVGLVGGSGCGKTTCARAALRLVQPSRGLVRVNGTDLARLRPKELRSFRRNMQMVFQDPGGSLNGRMRVGELVAEPLVVHGLARGTEVTRRACELLERCGLQASDADKWPHQFSGGQRQRIGIARALATGPSLLICDEPTSSLDVSVQAKILNLLEQLRGDQGLAMLFITHDLAVARHVCDRIAVMEDGKIIESGKARDIIDHPEHPLTRQLIDAVDH
jgi:ABC-type oligopeptide transport system ATPase subunit